MLVDISSKFTGFHRVAMPLCFNGFYYHFNCRPTHVGFSAAIRATSSRPIICRFVDIHIERHFGSVELHY